MEQKAEKEVPTSKEEEVNENQESHEGSEQEEDMSKSGKEEEPTTEESIAEKEKEAFRFMEEKNYNDALDLFSQVLDYKVERYGHLGAECAPTYFAYGKVIFNSTKEEHDKWGGMVKKNLTKQLNGDEEEEDSDEEPTMNPAQALKQASEGYEHAWEVLEVARVIFSKDPTKTKELSEVYIWLGDVCLEEDDMAGAAENYRQCLALREQLYPPNDRKLADVHYMIGLAYQFQGNSQAALKHFESSKKVFDTLLENAKKENKQDDITDFQDIVVELAVKVDELKAPVEVSALLRKELPTETIGFAKPTSESLPVIDLGSFKKNSTVATTTATSANGVTTIREKTQSQDVVMEPPVTILNVKRKIDQVSGNESEQKTLRTN